LLTDPQFYFRRGGGKGSRWEALAVARIRIQAPHQKIKGATARQGAAAVVGNGLAWLAPQPDGGALFQVQGFCLIVSLWALYEVK